MAATFKDARLLLRSKVQSSKYPSSKTKHQTPSTEKENLILNYIKKREIRSSNKNQTYNIGRIRKENLAVAESADIVRKKTTLQDSLVCKGLEYNIKHKEHFNLTMGNKKEEKKNLFITADVSSALKALRKQIKMDTMGSRTKEENMMTEEDIDQLFEGTLPDQKASARNIQIEKIKQLLESEPIEYRPPKKVQKTLNKDYADSIKYLELEDGDDKLLAALDQAHFMKVQPQKGVDKTAKFKEQFIVGKQIGEGAYASVRVAIYSSLNKKIAIKIYEKRKIKQPQRKKSVRREIKILQQAHHKNIVKIFDVIETNNHVNLIMEYIPGVCLSNYLKSQPDCRLGEKAAKKLMQQMVEAIVYLHGQNICHRDIKLQNILLDNQLSPKLIDFGFATCIDNSKKVKMFCGTPSFMAPEIVTKQEYKGPPADIWALGVVLFVMLTGVFPFKGQTDKQLYGKICGSQYPNIEHLSKSAQSLIRMMLNVDADHRISGQQILEHEWLKPVIEKKSSFVFQPEKHDLLECYDSRVLEYKKVDNSKDKRTFALTESSFNLKQMLRNAQELKLSPRPPKNESTTNSSKPSTPLLEQAKKQSRIQIEALPFERLTNKAYF